MASGPAEAGVAPAAPAAGALDPHALSTQLEELARQGKLTPEFIENLRQELAGEGGGLQGILGGIAAQIQALTRLGRKPEEEGE